VIKISKYGHAIILSYFGILFIAHFNTILSWFIGGYIIGFALRLARQAGREDEE
jgi:hypothetical protein